MELELQRSSYDLLPIRKKQMTFFNQVGVCMLGFLFYFILFFDWGQTERD